MTHPLPPADLKELSICIPTYNRAAFLIEAIESVVSQVTPEMAGHLEICISDNASADDTEARVRECNARHPGIEIVYWRNEINRGADHNFIRVIELARGRFCWYLGSDDKLEPGALARIWGLLRDHPEVDIFVGTRFAYDYHFMRRLEERHYLNEYFHSDHHFRQLGDTLSAVTYALGYISILIFNRAGWNRVAGHEKYLNTAYVHVFKLLSMIKTGASVYYVRSEIVGSRSGNDSFLDQYKLEGRLKLDVFGFKGIAADLFGRPSVEYKAAIKSVLREQVRLHLEILKSQGLGLRLRMTWLYFRSFGEIPYYYQAILPRSIATILSAEGLKRAMLRPLRDRLRRRFNRS
jgi:abequosyltransferase